MAEMEKYELSFGVLYRAGDRWKIITREAEISGFTKYFAKNIDECDEFSEEEKNEIFRVVAEYHTANALKSNSI